jgi:hypothetical protein
MTRNNLGCAVRSDTVCDDYRGERKQERKDWQGEQERDGTESHLIVCSGCLIPDQQNEFDSLLSVGLVGESGSRTTLLGL